MIVQIDFIFQFHGDELGKCTIVEYKSIEDSQLLRIRKFMCDDVEEKGYSYMHAYQDSTHNRFYMVYDTERYNSSMVDPTDPKSQVIRAVGTHLISIMDKHRRNTVLKQLLNQ